MRTVDAGGAEIPALGIGTAQLSEETCRQSVRRALEAGYRHVDTAEYYDNERAVGQALAAAPVDRLRPGLRLRFRNALPSLMRRLGL